MKKVATAGNTFLLFHQVPVVQKVDSTIHWINHYPLDITLLVSLKLIHWIAIYLVPVVKTLDSKCYPPDKSLSSR